jgi:hypothetical protein
MLHEPIRKVQSTVNQYIKDKYDKVTGKKLALHKAIRELFPSTDDIIPVHAGAAVGIGEDPATMMEQCVKFRTYRRIIWEEFWATISGWKKIPDNYKHIHTQTSL